MARGLVCEPPVAVGEWQEEEHDVAGALHALHDTGRRGDEVAVREHAPLRGPCRAGGVDERREVVLLDRLGLQMLRQPPLGLELLEPVERDHLAQRGQGAADGYELAGLLLVLGEGEHGLAVLEDVLAFLGGARRIETDDDSADRHHRPVEQNPLEPRAREHCDPVAVPDSARQ